MNIKNETEDIGQGLVYGTLLSVVLWSLAIIIVLICSGCGAISSKGIGFNGAIYGIDETKYSQQTEKRSQPLACLFSAKWCNDTGSEKEGS